MLRDPNSYNTILGFLVLDIPQAVFEEILSAAEISDQNAICVCDRNGRIVSSPTTANLLAEEQYAAYISSIPPGQSRGVIQDKNGIQLYAKLENADWYVFSGISMPSAATGMLTTSVGSMLLIVCLVLILFSGFVFVLIELVDYHIQHKTNKILHRMNDIDADNLVLHPESDNHFDVLENKVNTLVSSVAELMEKSYAEKLRTKDMELRLLQAQINPHFLYNSIDQIYWKAMQHNAPDVAQMLSSLAKYFRLSLHKGESIVLIADEIALVKTYLSLQKSRFGMRLSAEVHVDPDAEKYCIPKMSLQPLVENALIHGILDAPDRIGIIVIDVLKNNDRILCTVKDNGMGMKADATSRLLLEETKNNKGSGYGVYSVMKRLQLVFDDDCRFAIHSVEGEGTTVSFAIPLKEKK